MEYNLNLLAPASSELGTAQLQLVFLSFSLSLSLSSRRLLKTIEGGVVGFQNFAWAPNSQKYEDSNEKQILGPPLPP